MAEYVEREAVIEEVSSITITITGMREGKSVLSEALTAYRKAVLSEIENASAADVVEVVHGEWIKEPGLWRMSETGESVNINRCSVCGLYFSHAPYNYCPNCGAKMDGGKHNE